MNRAILIIQLLCISITISFGRQIPVRSPWPDEEPLRQRFETYVQSLDSLRIAKDYPKAIRHLQSTEPKQQILGIRILAATEEPEIVPWIFPFLDSKEPYVQVEAGIAFDRLVSAHAIRRRDPSDGYRVVILPLKPEDPDLRPLAWIALKMLKMDPEGSMGAYGITMAGYLQLKEFAEGLRRIATSDSPRAEQAKEFLTHLE